MTKDEYYKALKDRQPDLYKFVKDMEKIFPDLKIEKVFKNVR